MLMSSGGYAASSSGCVTRPRAREIGSTGYAGPTQRSLLIGLCVMATAEHREPCDSRGSCTVLGAPRGEIPLGDSTIAAEPAKIKTFNERVYRTNWIVLGHVVVKHGWEKCALAPVNPFHKA